MQSAASFGVRSGGRSRKRLGSRRQKNVPSGDGKTGEELSSLGSQLGCQLDDVPKVKVMGEDLSR